LGFVKNKDIPMGPFRWLTVSSPEGGEGVELVLEPTGFAPAQTYQKALFAAGIPATAFLTSDIQSGASKGAWRQLPLVNQRAWNPLLHLLTTCLFNTFEIAKPEEEKMAR